MVQLIVVKSVAPIDAKTIVKRFVDCCVCGNMTILSVILSVNITLHVKEHQPARIKTQINRHFHHISIHTLYNASNNAIHAEMDGICFLPSKIFCI